MPDDLQYKIMQTVSDDETEEIHKAYIKAMKLPYDLPEIALQRAADLKRMSELLKLPKEQK